MARVLSADWVLPVEGAPIENGAVAIEGTGSRPSERSRSSARGSTSRRPRILPGLVNAHSHLEYAVYAGFGDGRSFAPWLGLHIERKARIGREEMEAVARLGAAECLASGITTVGDAAFAGASAHACAELGLRAIVYLEVFGADPDEAMRQFEGGSSTRVPLSPSACAPASRLTRRTPARRRCTRPACALGVPVMTHFNESQDELDWLERGEGPMRPVAEFLIEPDGQTGIRRLAAAGLLGAEIVAAHCVKLADDELELLARYDVAVAHCPRSNALLGCGIAPLEKLRAAGLRVGIGTDGVSSVPSTTSSTSSGPCSLGRVLAPSAPTPSHRPPRSSWRRSAARARSASPRRSARSSRASAPTSP